jgi:hypothetical protein
MITFLNFLLPSLQGRNSIKIAMNSDTQYSINLHHFWKICLFRTLELGLEPSKLDHVTVLYKSKWCSLFISLIRLVHISFLKNKFSKIVRSQGWPLCPHNVRTEASVYKRRNRQRRLSNFVEHKVCFFLLYTQICRGNNYMFFSPTIANPLTRISPANPLTFS